MTPYSLNANLQVALTVLPDFVSHRALKDDLWDFDVGSESSTLSRTAAVPESGGDGPVPVAGEEGSVRNALRTAPVPEAGGSNCTSKSTNGFRGGGGGSLRSLVHLVSVLS